jgi:hypothetical protein
MVLPRWATGTNTEGPLGGVGRLCPAGTVLGDAARGGLSPPSGLQSPSRPAAVALTTLPAMRPCSSRKPWGPWSPAVWSALTVAIVKGSSSGGSAVMVTSTGPGQLRSSAQPEITLPSVTSSPPRAPAFGLL